MQKFGMYKSTIFDIFNRHVSIRKKYICANEVPKSEELHKTIMKRSSLRNYSWNIKPILTKKATAPKEISGKKSWKALNLRHYKKYW